MAVLTWKKNIAANTVLKFLWKLYLRNHWTYFNETIRICYCYPNFLLYTSFIGYINNTIYFNSHMHIDEQITNIIPKWIHVFIQDCDVYKHENSRNVFYLYFFWNKYLRQPSIDFDFWKLMSSGDVVYMEHWWHDYKRDNKTQTQTCTHMPSWRSQM